MQWWEDNVKQALIFFVLFSIFKVLDHDKILDLSLRPIFGPDQLKLSTYMASE